MVSTQQESISTVVSHAFAGFLQAFSAISPQDVNKVPYANSWTAAQVVLHVTLSTTLMIRLTDERGVAARREPGARVDELEKIFLDFSATLDAPDMIVPPPGVYEKDVLIENLESAIATLLEKAARHNLDELLSAALLGDVTRLELLYFVSFHTRRHTHQLERIAAALGY